jgi:plastocyanin/mono/diheme cytochrome c family protein
VGAVQKLATVVMVGLVALATVLTVYIAREPDRRDSETTEQEEIAIERGTDLYIQYCLQCHGPAGLGNSEAANEDPARMGPALNKEGAGIPEDPPDTFVNFQSDNPAEQELAEDFIHYRIVNGAPSDPRLEKVMPAFGTELNVQEINDLVYMIMNADWNYVYNQAVQQTGEAAAQAECDANDGEGEYCAHIEEAPPLYPTVPPPADAGGDEGASEGQPDASPSADAANGDAAVTVEAQDPYSWSTTEITVKPGDTIAVVPSGGLEHDFVVDELGINEPLPAGSSDAIMVTIPEDAEPGEYTFYCSVPGHRESGMEGTLTIEGS